jgi:hypothetical protein
LPFHRIVSSAATATTLRNRTGCRGVTGLAAGSGNSTLLVIGGKVKISMISRTSMMSISGVVLSSDIGSAEWVERAKLIDNLLGAV